ncbi:DUF937 domain-containing protein [Methylocystis sp. L43]|jgi:hypothetical protein|uniref:DUF937 domain-containing protein n=1 Tax=unclassified Methylocystis TaxID=2625913 RepID=UPI0018C21599|nr:MULTISPECIES: DUF937 domain-containing protein [unclassified Methylocystis]MBG0798441.1 DUF937 domain-containing protein [Methylocystis sp. L43]MBG0805915.1 DUF937 domain-containing protein [Methylocystis sp. H15]
MSYLDEILQSAQGGQLVSNLAQRFGLSDEQMDRAIKALAPALEVGLSNAAEQPALFEKVLGDIASPLRAGAFDDPGAAQDADSLAQSRQLLADLFGSPAAAGQVVQVAARESGLRPDILSQLLPVLVSVLIGGLFKNVSNRGLGGVLGQLVSSGALGSILEQMLGGARTPQPEPAPMPTPRGGATGGGGLLGGLLGSILGSLLGGRRTAPDSYGGPTSDAGGLGRGGPLDLDRGAGRSQGMPEDMDQASIQQAIEEIQKTLQIGRSSGGENAGARSDFESILGQMFGKR